MSFFKISISHILKQLKVRNDTFSPGIRYMLLANKKHKKQRKKKHVAYFF